MCVTHMACPSAWHVQSGTEAICLTHVQDCLSVSLSVV